MVDICKTKSNSEVIKATDSARFSTQKLLEDIVPVIDGQEERFTQIESNIASISTDVLL